MGWRNPWEVGVRLLLLGLAGAVVYLAIVGALTVVLLLIALVGGSLALALKAQYLDLAEWIKKRGGPKFGSGNGAKFGGQWKRPRNNRRVFSSFTGRVLKNRK